MPTPLNWFALGAAAVCAWLGAHDAVLAILLVDAAVTP